MRIFLGQLILVFLLFHSNNSQSQSQLIEEYNRLELLCKKNMRTPDSLIFYSNKLLKFSEKNHFENGVKSAYRFLGFANSRLRNYEKSNQYYHKALYLAKQLDDEQMEYLIYNDLSLNHRATKYNDSAIYYSHKLIKHYKIDFKESSLNMAYMNMGINHYSKMSLDSAQFYLQKSIKGFKETNNLRFLATSLSLLAEVYYQKNDIESALKFTDSSQTISENINFKMNYSRNYNLFARIYKKLNNETEYNKFLELEKANSPKNIRGQDFREVNDNYKKSRIEHNINKEQHLEKEKDFYLSTLFKIGALAVFLFIISYFFYSRNQKNKKDLQLLQNKLKVLSKKKAVHPKSLIKLKSNAVIDTNNLLYIKSEGHYLNFFINGKKNPEIDRNSLINILETLPSNQFVRIHKSYIVNIDRIKIMNSNKIMLDTGEWINLSRVYKQALKDILNKE